MRFYGNRILATVLFAATLTFALQAAPPSGVLVGLVTDRSGIPASRIKVVLIGSDGVRHEGATDAEGFFSFSLLPPDEYRLEPVSGQFLLPGDKLILGEGEKRSCRLIWDDSFRHP